VLRLAQTPGMSIADPQGTSDHRLRTAAQNLKLYDTFQKGTIFQKIMNHQQLFIKPDRIVAGHNLLFTNGVSKVGGGQIGAKIQKHTWMPPDRNSSHGHFLLTNKK